MNDEPELGPLNLGCCAVLLLDAAVVVAGVVGIVYFVFIR